MKNKFNWISLYYKINKTTYNYLYLGSIMRIYPIQHTNWDALKPRIIEDFTKELNSIKPSKYTVGRLPIRKPASFKKKLHILFDKDWCE